MPTAQTLPPEERAQYIKAARRRILMPLLSPEQQRIRERLLQRVHDAAEVLRTRFGARRVVLFGSLAHGLWFSPHSDIDLAVEGLQSSDYWAAWRCIEEFMAGRSVDLIEMETARDALKRAIARHGIAL